MKKFSLETPYFEYKQIPIYLAEGKYYAMDRPQQSLPSLQAAIEAIERRKWRFTNGHVNIFGKHFVPVMWGQGIENPAIKWAFRYNPN